MSQRYSIVVTCRGRLPFLLQTLPSLLAQPEAEVVVVDYSCPENTAGVVAERYPAAVIAKVEGADSFHLADARNVGAHAASGEILIFVDADIVIAPDFVARIDAQMREGVFFHFPLSETIRGWSGTCVVPKRHFDRIEGYDDLIHGYGGDDLDLYFRLSRIPLKALLLDPSYIARILRHSAKSRTAHYNRSRAESVAINFAYLQMKFAALRFYGTVTMRRAIRERIYRTVRERLTAMPATGLKRATFSLVLQDEVALPQLDGWNVSRRLTLRMERAQDGRGAADGTVSDSLDLLSANGADSI